VIGAGLILLLGGLVAAVMPARHAARLHPVEALRAE
jgi:ABC-type antimicrobial peptide transport system permease subunit